MYIILHYVYYICHKKHGDKDIQKIKSIDISPQV